MPGEQVEKIAAGHVVKCAGCNGHGLYSVWSFDVKEPEECPDCGGSGRNWQYPSGLIARYYSGPIIGRAGSRSKADAN